MKSLLYQPGQLLREPPNCGPSRKEVVAPVVKDGRTYMMIFRDKTVELDPYLVQVKAAAFAVRTGEPYMGRAVPRATRQVYVRNSTSA